MTSIKRILITPGEPAGIGPDVLLKIIQKSYPHQLIAVCDPDLLIARAKQLNLKVNIVPFDLEKKAEAHQAFTLPVLAVPLLDECIPSQLNKKNAAYVLATLNKAAELSLAKKVHGVVTGPVHKAIMNDAGIAFSGHTEFFADFCKVPLTVMLFVVDDLKVALATTHLPLKEVPGAITKTRLKNIITILIKGLKKQFGITSPRLIVTGLNPHAGEEGHLGREEIEIITPALNELRDKYDLIGPIPADTAFTPYELKKGDAVLAMYHDQALPLVKHLGFSHAVNVTLGLPFIRTSVDHGTALSLAGTGNADERSMQAAIDLSVNLSLQD